jgi:hypothetical protein
VLLGTERSIVLVDATGRLRRVRTDRQPRLFETGRARGFVLHGTVRAPRRKHTAGTNHNQSTPPAPRNGPSGCSLFWPSPSCLSTAILAGRTEQNGTERRGLSQTGAATSEAAAYKCRSRARLKDHHGSRTRWRIASASERAGRRR